MFKIKKWFFVSLTIVLWGEINFTNKALANDGGSHDTSTGTTTQSQVDNDASGNSLEGTLNSVTGEFSVQGLGNGITLSPDVLQSFLGGDLGGDGIGRRNTVTGDADSLNPDSSNNVTICLSDPCVPSGESTRAMTLNELAELIEQDLQKSLTELAAAEAVEQRASNQPRSFVRRRATNCVNPAIQAREIVQQKLEQAQNFIGQIDELISENNRKW